MRAAQLHRARASSMRTSTSWPAASRRAACSCGRRAAATTFVERVARVRRHRAARAPGLPAGTGTTRRGAAHCPRRGWIDAVTPDHPVWVNRLDGHMALANAAALAAAGVTRTPRTSRAARSSATPGADPTGLLRDNAMAPGRARGPAAWRRAAGPRPGRRHAPRGRAGCHLASTTWATFEDLAVFERAHAAGRLRTRIYAAVPLARWARLRDHMAATAPGPGRARRRRGCASAPSRDSWTARSGSHTAAFEEPFTDAPDDRGLLVNSEATSTQWIAAADRAGAAGGGARHRRPRQPPAARHLRPRGA